MSSETISESISKPALKERYAKFTGKKVLFVVILLIGMILLMSFSATLGTAPITIGEVYSTIMHRLLPDHFPSCGLSDIVIWRLRLPRIILAVLSGIGLAVAGTVMQAILRNPLASPFTLGIASAGSFGATLAIILGVGFGFAGGTLVMVNAFIFAMIASFLILGLASYKRATPGTMILVGIAISFTFGAGTSLLQFFGEREEIVGVVFWMFGSVGRATWTNITILSLVLLFCAPYLIWKAKDFNVLGAGDETAKSLGVNVERLRLLGMLATSLITAVIISYTGIIGFIGLVCPHIARMVIGGDNRFLLPAASLLGAIILLGADTLARTILAPVIIPVGIMTSFLGGPLFFYLLMRQKGGYW